MITPPPGWVRHSGVHALALEPPSGKGRIRVHERAPVRRFRQLVEDLLEDEPAFTVRSEGRVERLLTAEGEFAAWVALTGDDADGAVRRWIGAVFLDEFVVLLDANSRDPGLDVSMAATARLLLVQSSFGLGVRRRRFWYVSPPGWLGVPGGLTTTWYPPDFPRRRSMIEVHAAEPCGDSVSACFAALLEDETRRLFARAGAVHEDVLRGQRGLTGKHFRYRGHWRHDQVMLDRHLALFTDGHHRYAIRLEAATGVDRAPDIAAFVALAASVEPLPRRDGSRAGQVDGAPDVTAHWTE